MEGHSGVNAKTVKGHREGHRVSLVILSNQPFSGKISREFEMAGDKHFTITRKHSSRIHTNHAVTRPSSEAVSMTPIVDRQTHVKTLPSLVVGNNPYKPASRILSLLDIYLVFHYVTDHIFNKNAD